MKYTEACLSVEGGEPRAVMHVDGYRVWYSLDEYIPGRGSFSSCLFGNMAEHGITILKCHLGGQVQRARNLRLGFPTSAKTTPGFAGKFS